MSAVISIPNSITGILELEGEMERGSCDINCIIVKKGKFFPLLNYLLVANYAWKYAYINLILFLAHIEMLTLTLIDTHVNSYAILLENLKFTPLLKFHTFSKDKQVIIKYFMEIRCIFWHPFELVCN